MKRRRPRKRRARTSARPLFAGFAALAVLACAIALIVRGDVTPRPHSSATAARRSVRVAQMTRKPAPTAAAGDEERAVPTPARTAPLPAAAAGESGTPSASPAPQPTTAPMPESAESPSATHAPRPTAAGYARLAIIIDDCGQWPETERAFIALGAPLTLSVLPHVRYGPEIARDAQTAGLGVMLHLPMEPRSGPDPGPGKVTTAMDDGAIANVVRGDLDAVPLAAGVNNHEGSRATSDDRVMRDVAAVLAQRHVFFVDSRTSAATVAARDAQSAGVPTASRDVFLDDVADVGATRAQLLYAARLAKANGSAIAIGHPRPTTLRAVRDLLPDLRRDGVELVLARDLVR